jgi:hypothetical protein
MITVYVLLSMIWVFMFAESEPKITHVWHVSMAVFFLYRGLEKLVTDTDAASAHVFGTIVKISMYSTIALFMLSFIFTL